MHTSHRQLGFTLIEMLVTVAILVLIAALATPLFGDNNALHLSSAKRLLISDLEHTQILAITNPDMEVGLVFDKKGSGWHIASLDNPKTPLNDSETGEPLALTLGEGSAYYCNDVHVENNSINDIIEFNSEGGVTGFLLDVEINLSVEDSKKTITINPITGSIK